MHSVALDLLLQVLAEIIIVGLTVGIVMACAPKAMRRSGWTIGTGIIVGVVANKIAGLWALNAFFEWLGG